MQRGYRLLAEASIREERLDDAFKAAKKLPEEPHKKTILREIRNGAVKIGDFELYQESSRMVGLDDKDPEDLGEMILVNVERDNLDPVAKMFALLPEDENKQHLFTTVIITFAHHGHMVACERIAKVCNIALTKYQATMAKVNAIRNGWIYDAERAARVLGAELTKEEYMELFVANKDKGLLFEAQESAKKAGIEIDKPVLEALLLAGVKNNRRSVWDVAEMI